MTIDTWDDEDAYRRFRQDYDAEYVALDAVCAALTSGERIVGQFVEIGRSIER